MRNQVCFKILKEMLEYRILRIAEYNSLEKKNRKGFQYYKVHWRKGAYMELATMINEKYSIRYKKNVDIISHQTIKRIFTQPNYVSEKIHKTKMHTLDILCQYLEYNDWDDYCLLIMEKRPVDYGEIEEMVNLTIKLLHNRVANSKPLTKEYSILKFYQQEKQLLLSLWGCILDKNKSWQEQHRFLSNIATRSKIHKPFFNSNWIEKISKKDIETSPIIIGKLLSIEEMNLLSKKKR